MINYTLAITQLYPNVKPSIDFSVCLDVDGSQYISEWNLEQPQPTQEELQAAWDQYQANPPSPTLDPISDLKKQQTDLVFQLMIKGVI